MHSCMDEAALNMSMKFKVQRKEQSLLLSKMYKDMLKSCLRDGVFFYPCSLPQALHLLKQARQVEALQEIAQAHERKCFPLDDKLRVLQYKGFFGVYASVYLQVSICRILR